MNELLRRLLMLPPQGSSVAAGIDHLHYFVILTTMAGWLGVTLVALVFIIKYRRRSRLQATPTVKATLGFELTVGGGLLALFLVWWFIGYREYVQLREPPDKAMEVYVVGKQWMWKFSYPDGRSSVSVLTVPAGQPVKLLMTSRDVIHSFFVPDFRVKQDVIPGRYTTLWFTAKEGVHQVLCAEYCGLLHSNMWASVVALNPTDWARWLEETRPAGVAGGPGSAPAIPAGREPAVGNEVPATGRTGVSFALADQGREVAERYGCFNCHTTDGRPHIGPSWRGLFGAEVSLEGGQKVIADESYLTESMMDPRKRLVQGFPAVMPSYQGILGPAEAGALVELIKSLHAPATGAPVIPPWTGTPGRGPDGQPVTLPAPGGVTDPGGGPGQRKPADPNAGPMPPPRGPETPSFEVPPR